jgi:hypothetical protein
MLLRRRIHFAAFIVTLNSCLALFISPSQPARAGGFGVNKVCMNQSFCLEGGLKCSDLDESDLQFHCDLGPPGVCRLCEVLCADLTTCSPGTAHLVCIMGGPDNPCP